MTALSNGQGSSRYDWQSVFLLAKEKDHYDWGLDKETVCYACESAEIGAIYHSINQSINQSRNQLKQVDQLFYEVYMIPRAWKQEYMFDISSIYHSDSFFLSHKKTTLKNYMWV